MTTSADVRALMCANLKWSGLPADEMRLLSQWRFIHPTARLIHELKFERPSPEGVLCITSFAFEEWYDQVSVEPADAFADDDDLAAYYVPEGMPYFIEGSSKNYGIMIRPTLIPNRSEFELGRVLD